MRSILLCLAIFSYAVFASEQKATAAVEEEPLYNLDEMLDLCTHFPGLSACQQLREFETTQPMEKRKSAYMRFGKRSSPVELDEQEGSPMEKRKSAYMRFGKRSSPNMELASEDGIEMAKRKSAYMRFGKRKSAYMRFGKRSSFSEDALLANGPMEKRKSAYMRFGKRR